MKAKILSLLLVVALVVTVSVFAAVANDADYTADFSNPDADGTVVTDCPACKEHDVTWQLFAQQEVSGHYYVQEDMDLTKTPTVGSGDEICLYIDDCVVTAASDKRAFLINKGTTAGAVTPELNIMGTGTLTGTGFVSTSSSGANNANGGLIYVHANGGILNIHDSVTVQIAAAGAETMNYGGVIYVGAAGELNVYGGTISGGGAGTNYGGAVYLTGGATMTMTGGTVRASTAGGTRGGAIYMTGTDSELNIGEDGATAKTAKIEGAGTAYTNGGLICNAGGTVNIRDGAWLTGGLSKGTSTSTGGGALYVTGITNIFGGLIENNTCNTCGGNIMVTNGGELNVSGGTITGGKAEQGGNIFNNGTVTISGGGTISSGSATDDTVDADTTSFGDNLGGNIYNNAKTITITGGTITGGTASDGGNIYMAAGSATMSAGTIQNGVATSAPTSTTGVQHNGGGNIFLNGGDFTMNGEDALIEGGQGYSGGNVRIDSGTFDMDNGTVQNGTSTTTVGNGYAGGGNFHVSDTLDVDGGTITGGYAKNNGGNIYVLNTTDVTINNATVSLADDATAIAANGGNIYIRRESADTGMTVGEGAVITCGANELTNKGRNIYLRNGVLTLAGGQIQGGMNGGNSIYVYEVATNKVELSGTAQVDQLYIKGTDTAQAEIKVGDTFAGNVRLRFADGTDAEKEFYNSIGYGTVITGNTNVTVAEGYANAGTIRVGAGAVGGTNLNAVYGDYDDDGTKELVVANYKKTDASGNSSYIVNLSEVGEGECLTLIQDDMELALSTDMIVDTNGKSATVNATADAEISLIDTTNDKFTATPGVLTVNGATVKTRSDVNGKTYIAVPGENNTYSAHRISAKLESVSLRTTCAGIYYNLAINCDDTLEALVQTYGLAVSLAKMPSADYVNEDMTLYTEISRCECGDTCEEPEVHFDEFASGSYTSALVDNILVDPEDPEVSNAVRAELPVYANGYVTILLPNDGGDVVLMTDDVNQGKTRTDADWDEEVGIAYSIHDIMARLDTVFNTPDVTDNSKKHLKNFYNKWESVMSGWELPNLQNYQLPVA